MVQRTTVWKTLFSTLVFVLSMLSCVPGFAQLSGTKTIGGTTPDYATIKAAFRALNAQGVAAPGVTFLIRSGTYAEDSLVIRTSTTSATATITIKPATGATVVIDVTPPATTYDFAIKVDSTKYVTFDGSNSGTTSRDMTINSLGGVGRRGIWFSGNCSYGVVKNCVVTAARDIAIPDANSRGIDFFYVGGDGTDADNALIENNLVRYAHTGIRLEGRIGTTVILKSTIVRNNVVDSVCNAGIYGQYHDNSLIYNNDINVKRGGFTPGLTPAMFGIHIGVFTSKARVHKNRVHDLNQLSTTTLATYGIYLSGTMSLARHSVFNNFIWGINVPENVAGTGPVYGIYSGITNSVIPDTFAFNTVTISGASGGIRPSYAFFKGSETGPAIAWNNILMNARNDSPAIAAAIGKVSALTQLTSNYNNLYVPATTDTTRNIGAIGTARYKSLSAWRAASSSDSRSLTENTPLLSANDLHIQPTVPTQIESGGTPVPSFSTDIDGQTRNATTPDIGADEGTFILQDLTGPAIAHTALANTPSTGNRIVVATLTDLSGVATGSGSPRLWYRINTAASYTPVAADSTVGAMRYFTIPGSPAGTNVRYYLAAQDLAPSTNVSTLPSGGSGSNPPGSTAPSTVFSYFVQTAIPAGTYTVGVGGNYPTIDSVFRKLSIDGVAGAVTFTLADTAYVASGKPLQNLRPAMPQYAIVNGQREELALPSAYEFDAPTIPALTLTGPIIGANATNRITFRPAAGRAVRILGNGAWVIRLLDASYVTFDGINSGGASLRLQATAGTGLQIEGNSDNVVVQNMQIGTPNFTAILLQPGANGIPDSTLVQRNTVDSYSFNGFLGLNTTVATNLAYGLRISNNNFGTATDSIKQAGIVVQYTDGAWISNNTVRNLRRAGDITGNEITGIAAINRHLRTRIWNNKVFDARAFGTAAVTIRGLRLFGTVGDTTRNAIYNNMIFNLDYAATSAGGSIRAIQHSLSILDTIAYNSIWLDGVTVASVPNVAFYTLSGSLGTTVRNNLVVNTRTPSGVGFGVSLAVFHSDSAGSRFISSDYNNLFVGATAGSHIGAYFNTLYATLPAWRVVTGEERNSINVRANFIGPCLHIDSTIRTPIDGGATPLPGFTTDIDGQPRNATTPDIGADEFTVTVSDVIALSEQVPASFDLAQNYPNPFNPTTRINYSLPTASRVSLKVFDVLGREVAAVVNEVQGSGFKSAEFDAGRFASGVYFYRIEAKAVDGSKEFRHVRKLIVMK